MRKRLEREWLGVTDPRAGLGVCRLGKSTREIESWKMFFYRCIFGEVEANPDFVFFCRFLWVSSDILAMFDHTLSNGI